MLIPNEKVSLVKELLENDSMLTTTALTTQPNKASKQEENTLTNDPWKHLLGDHEWADKSKIML